jgi:acyl carrier protein
MTPMTENRLFAVVQEAVHRRFGIPLAAITKETTAADVPGWDSVKHAALLIELESLLGVELPVEELFTVENLGELCYKINQATR